MLGGKHQEFLSPLLLPILKQQINTCCALHVYHYGYGLSTACGCLDALRQLHTQPLILALEQLSLLLFFEKLHRRSLTAAHSLMIYS